MIQWGEQACIDGKPVPLVSCRGMVTQPTNVKYALSTFLQDRRTERDVFGAPTLTFPPVSHRRLAQVT